MGNLNETFGQQARDTTGQLTQAAGGIGSDRIAVGQSELARQQGLAAGQTLAGLYQPALSAAQNDASRQANAAYTFGNLGQTAQNAQLQGTQALLGTGNQQQAQQQAQLNSPYQQQLAQLAYPFQTAQYLSGITGSLAPAFGGTTNGQTTYPGPSTAGTYAGLGMAGLGLAGGFGGAGGKGSGSYSGPGTNPLTNGGATAGYGPNGEPWSAARGGAITYARGGAIDDDIVPNIDLSKTPQVHYPTLPPVNTGGGSGGGAGGSGGGMGGFNPMQLMQLGQSGGKFLGGIGKGSGAAGGAGAGEAAAGAAGAETAGAGAAEWLPYVMAVARDGGAITANQPFQHFAVGGGTDLPFNDRFPGIPEYLGSKPQPDSFTDRFPPQGEGLGSLPPMSPRDRINQGFGAADEAVANGTMDPQGANQGTQVASTQPNIGPFVGSQQSPQPDASGDPQSPVQLAQNENGAPDVQSDAPPAYAGQGPLPYQGAEEQMDAGQKFTRSPWMALVRAGLATIAAQNSRDSRGLPAYPLAAIAKGGEEGLKTLDEQREAISKEQSVNQQAKQLAQQAQFHLDKYTKLTKAEEQTAELQKAKEEREKAAALRDRFQFESLPGGAWKVLDKQTMQSKVIQPNGAAQQPSSGAVTEKGESPTGPFVAVKDAAPSPLGKDYNTTAPIRVPDRSVIPQDPLLSGKNWQTTASRMWQDAIKQPTTDRAGAEKALVKIAQIESSLGDLPEKGLLAPGKAFAERTLFANWIGTLKRMTGMQEGSPEYLAAAQEVQKLNTQLGFDLSRTLGAREAMQIVQQATAAVPGGEMSPEGARRVIAGLKASLQRDVDRSNFYNAYSQVSESPRLAANYFEKMYPAEHYQNLEKLYQTSGEIKSNEDLQKAKPGMGYRAWDEQNNRWTILKYNRATKGWEQHPLN